MLVVVATGCRTVPPVPAPADATAGPRAGKSDRAEEKAMERRAKAHAHYAAGVVHDLNEEPELALAEFYAAAKGDPEDEQLALSVAQRFLQNKQYEKALELLRPAAARPDASGLVFARLGFIYSQLGQTDKAIAANREAVKKMPDSLMGYRNLYLNYLQTKQPAAALQVLDEAAAQRDVAVDFWIGLAELYSNYSLQFPTQRDAARAKARVALTRAAETKRLPPALRLQLADGFNQFGDTDQAARQYLELLKQSGDLPLLRESVRAKLADIYLRTKDRTNAVEQLTAILRDDPANASAYYYLGSIAADERRWPDAVGNFEKVILFNPGFEPVYYDLANAQLASSKPGDAIATLQTARQKFAASFILEYLLGSAQHQQKNYAEAIKHFTAAEVMAQAGETNRLTHGFYFQLGATYERKGDRAQAERYFEKSLALAPDDPETLNYLGYMWAEHGEKLDQARGLIERALKAEPDNAAFLDSMGWVLFQLGQPAQALEYLLKSVKLSEEPDATLYDHLGDIYAAMKEMDKAREYWRKSLAIEPSSAVQKKLDALKP